MKEKESLTMGDLDDLKELEADLRRLRKRWRKLVARLERARRGAPVKDRLLCVLHDCLSPALRDLRSIEAAARESSRTHSPKRRRADANSVAPSRSR